jgi:hypothetical protein
MKNVWGAATQLQLNSVGISGGLYVLDIPTQKVNFFLVIAKAFTLA